MHPHAIFRAISSPPRTALSARLPTPQSVTDLMASDHLESSPNRAPLGSAWRVALLVLMTTLATQGSALTSCRGSARVDR